MSFLRPVRLISCCSFRRFCAVCWMPAPMPLARLRNSELCWIFACVCAAPGMEGPGPARKDDPLSQITGRCGNLSMTECLRQDRGHCDARFSGERRYAASSEEAYRRCYTPTMRWKRSACHTTSLLIGRVSGTVRGKATSKRLSWQKDYLATAQPFYSSVKVRCTISAARAREGWHPWGQSNER